MQLTDEFTIPTPPDEVFEALLDLRNVAPCVPGGEIGDPDADGVYPGKVVVKLGPMKFAYAGTLSVVESDATARRAVIEGSGNASGGGETARVRSVMQVEPAGEGSLVRISSDIEVRGRAAQMGASLMGAVSKQMVKKTAKCLAEKLAPSL